jgi:hypothetical protein
MAKNARRREADAINPAHASAGNAGPGALVAGVIRAVGSLDFVLGVTGR